MPFNENYLSWWIGLMMFFYSSSLKAQEKLDFDITLAGFTIGEMKASKTQNSDTTIYLLESKVSFWLFGTINVDYLTRVKYVDGIFINSVVSSKTNRGDFISKIWQEDDHYKIDAQAYKYEHKGSINEPIYHSAVRLFFEEPNGVNLMMAETLGKYASVKSLGKGIYTTHVEGNDNKYFYEDGRLLKVSMDSPIKNYEIRQSEK
jgi:hypothetical protein